MPSSCGGWGSDAASGRSTGRVPSARSKARLHRAVEDRPVPASAAAGRRRTRRDPRPARAAGRARRRGRRARCGRTTRAIDGWWPSRSTASPGLADGLVADAAGVAPLQREVLPDEHAELVGGVVELGPADVRVQAHEVEAGVRGQDDVAAQLLGGGVAERPAGRAEVGALEEQPLAVDREHPVVQRHLAEAGAHRAGVADLVVDEHRRPSSVDQRLVAERPRPPQRGVVDAELPRRPRWRPWRGVARTRRSTRSSTVVRMRTVRALVAVELGHAAAGTARSSLGLAAEHPEPVDPHRAACARRAPAARAARVPVGSMQSQCWKTPGDVALGLRSRWRRAGDLDGQQVLGAEAGEVGDLVGVREEVALGVAEVGAVEPDVALVEDAVEHEPVAGAARRRCRARSGSGRSAGRRCRRRPACDRQWPGTAIGSQPSSSYRADGVAAQVVVGDRRPPQCPTGPYPASVRDSATTRWADIGLAAESAAGRRSAASESTAGRRQRPARGSVPGMSSRPATLGQLRESGWESLPGQGGGPAQRRRQDRRRRAALRAACSATRTRSCRSWRTPCSPGTT